ncbi:MAG: hypothetical protein IAE77_17955 [Prosthecobacter sp.]|jgi:hypothetical protein|uniref:hypothetical protein n=1 Tax=Prosthecobacter sp. TaxID=1965333 RepID=UPI0019F7E241|nr:hypothetical protein [Prosthecobacter sp.]MBE2285350.1 hypothetical protein [Prosthecobacter sp.]
MKPTFHHLTAIVTWLCFAVISCHAELRTFTSSAGTTLKGELVSVVGDSVTIKKEDGTPLMLKLAAFSRVDQAWLQSQTAPAPASTSAAATSALSESAIISKAAPPLPYADMVQEIRWKGEPVKLEHRGSLPAKIMPLDKIFKEEKTNYQLDVRALAFHPDGRICFAHGTGSGAMMGLRFWDAPGKISRFVTLTHASESGDQAKREADQAKGLFGVFTGSVAFDKEGGCYLSPSSGSRSAIHRVLTADPVAMEKWRPVNVAASLQIPFFDDGHLYVRIGDHVDRVMLEKADNWKNGVEEWFRVKGADIRLTDALLLTPSRMLVCVSIRRPDVPANSRDIQVFHTLLVDFEQKACWLLPGNEVGPMALSWDGKRVVRYHKLSYTLVEISLETEK